MKKVVFALLACILFVSGCGSKDEKESTKKDTSQNESSQTESSQTEESERSEEKNDELTFDEPFEFDGFELTISSDIEWSSVKNPFSENNGADVILVPIHIKNISGETKSFNMFYLTLFGSSGVELENVDAYFDNTLGYGSSSLRDGVETDSILALLYDGDGDYYIEFSDFFDKLEVKLPISK